MSYYPQISAGTLTQFQSVFQLMESDPGYLDDPACPFSDEVKAFFKNTEVGKGSIVGGGDIYNDKETKPQTLERQVSSLVVGLDELAKIMTNKDHTEKLAYFKTKTTLIEKLVSMQERIFNLKEMAEFQSIVMKFMEDVCNKDQISELRHRLEHMVSQERTE